MSQLGQAMGVRWSGGLYSLPGRTHRLEGVPGGAPRPVGAGWRLLGGAGASLEVWRGLGVERSRLWVEGASGVVGARWPSSPTSRTSSLSKVASDSSSSEGAGASG